MTAVDTTLEPQPAARLMPVQPKDRIFTLDMLRGWAILGILAVNAIMFAWPMALDFNPGLVAPFPDTDANIAGEWVTKVFFKDKFRSLFSMLFGCSIFLIGGELADKARGGLLMRRLFWLAVFGLVHGLAFWFGDILLHYAYCALLVMLVRSWSGRLLILVGGGISLLLALLALLAGFMMASPAVIEAMASSGGGAGAQAGNPFMITQAQLEASIAAYQQGGVSALSENLSAWVTLQSASLMIIPVTVSLMIFGMGLFKTGFLTGRSPTWIYLIFLVLGGANLAAIGWYGWDHLHAAAGTYTPASGFFMMASSFAWVITLGYVSLLVLMTRFGLRWLTGVLAPVGRMAFTNYLAQTLIVATVFYLPWGPHLFGQPEWGPARLWTLIGAIWLAQLIWSPLWLSVFQMGPLEWLWRCLTYRRWVPIRKAAAA